jgi:hypothetical protein
VVGAHAFARGAPLGLGGHDRDGTVFQPGRPSARAHQATPGQRPDQPVAPYRRRCTPTHVEVRSRNVSRSGRPPLIAIADYELLTAADNSSVMRCRIANSVHQMHEASGRILALAHTALLYEITGDEAGVPWIR